MKNGEEEEEVVQAKITQREPEEAPAYRGSERQPEETHGSGNFSVS